jgi:hypothetical protein
MRIDLLSVGDELRLNSNPPLLAAHDQEIQLRTGMCGPEETLFGARTKQLDRCLK